VNTWTRAGSGSAASRPEFDRLLNDARLRRIDAVLVWKLDRWGRSVAASVKSIQEFVSLGVRFIAITQISTPPAATLCLGSSCTSLRPSRSLSANSFGSESRLEYAWPKHEESKSEGPSGYSVADEAVRLRAEGKSWRTIAHPLDVPVATLIDACKPPR